jgi:hypothetical protein
LANVLLQMDIADDTMSTTSLCQRYLGIVFKPCLAGMLIMIATCLVRSLYKRVDKGKQPLSPPSPRPNTFDHLLASWRRLWPAHRQTDSAPAQDDSPLPSSSRARKRKMRYQRSARQANLKRTVSVPAPETLNVDVKVAPSTKQPYDAFLVVDFEGTCMLGTDFNYPNEIIVCTMCSDLPRNQADIALGVSCISSGMDGHDGRDHGEHPQSQG